MVDVKTHAGISRPTGALRGRIARSYATRADRECGDLGLLLPSRAAGPAPTSNPRTPTATMARFVYLRDCSVCHGADRAGHRRRAVTAGRRAGVRRLLALDGPHAVGRQRSPREVAAGRAARRPARCRSARADPDAASPLIHGRCSSALENYVASIAPGGPGVPDVDLRHADLAVGGQVFRRAVRRMSLVVGGRWRAVSAGGTEPAGVARRPRLPRRCAPGPGRCPRSGTRRSLPIRSTISLGTCGISITPTNPGGDSLWFLGPVAEGAVAIILGLGAPSARVRDGSENVDERRRRPRCGERRDEFLIAAAFGVASLAALGLAVLYWLGGQPQLEGSLLALAGRRYRGRPHRLVAPAAAERPRGRATRERDERSRYALRRSRRIWIGAVCSRVGACSAASLGAAVVALGVAFLFPLRSLGPRPSDARAQRRRRGEHGTRLVGADGRRRPRAATFRRRPRHRVPRPARRLRDRPDRARPRRSRPHPPVARARSLVARRA